MAMTHTQCVDRLYDIRARMQQLSDKGDHMTRADDDAFRELVDEWDVVDARRLELVHRQGVVEGVRDGNGGHRLLPGTQRDDDRHDYQDGWPPSTVRDAAMRTIDGHVRNGALPTRAAEAVEALTRSGSRMDQSWAARCIAATGSDNYLRAFSMLVADPQRGHLLWTEQEASAFREVEGLRAETRAMSSVDNLGGYLSPLVVDPSIMITSGGSTNPLRQISRVVQTVSDTWNGVTSAGVTAEWLAEAAEASDASPTLAQPSIPVYKGSAFVPFSYEVGMDAVDFVSEISKLLHDAYDQLTAQAYTTGSGTGQPTGIVTALVASSPTVVVNSTGADALASGDVYALQNALPPRWQANAQWCANLSVLNTLRQFETAGGALKFPGLQNRPPILLGRNANELSNMDGVINGGQENYVLIYGDFRNFVIVDRFPSVVELLPNLVGANRRPTGQRGLFLWGRTGSDSVNDRAFQLLDVT